MISSSELAKLVLSFGSFTHKKLQKISYYLYSWYLTVYGKKLSNTRYEAWVHGPVSPEIYNEYKFYGWELIPQYNEPIFIDEEVFHFANKVVEYYSKYSANELEQMTHNELPWKNARVGYNWYDSSNELIKDADIISYYSKTELYNYFKS